MSSSSVSIITQSPTQRLRRFAGLISLSALTIFTSFFAAHYYYKAEAARLEIQIQENAVAMENAKKLRTAQILAMQNFQLRNEVENIALKQHDPALKHELLQFRDKLAAELKKTEDLLTTILESTQYKKGASYSSDFHLSIFSEANAAEKQPMVQPQQSPPYVLYLSTAIIFLLFFVCCWVLLFSKDAGRVKFAQTMIQSLSGFAIGVISGPTLTKS